MCIRDRFWQLQRQTAWSGPPGRLVHDSPQHNSSNDSLAFGTFAVHRHLCRIEAGSSDSTLRLTYYGSWHNHKLQPEPCYRWRWYSNAAWTYVQRAAISIAFSGLSKNARRVVVCCRVLSQSEHDMRRTLAAWNVSDTDVFVSTRHLQINGLIYPQPNRIEFLQLCLRIMWMACVWATTPLSVNSSWVIVKSHTVKSLVMLWYIVWNQLHARPSHIKTHHIVKHTKLIRHTVIKTHSQLVTEKSCDMLTLCMWFKWFYHGVYGILSSLHLYIDLGLPSFIDVDPEVGLPLALSCPR